MSEFPTPAPTMKPLDGVPQAMCIQLQNSALNDNGFTESSSSTSSPDSVCSLCSMDVDLPVGIMGRNEATSDNDSGIQSPEFRPDDNDNSVSVYLDATEGSWHADYDDQDDITLILDQKHEHDNDFGKLAVQSLGDSFATDAPLVSSEDEEGENEEDSFFSLTTSDVIMRNKMESDIQALSGDQPSADPMRQLHQEALKEMIELFNVKGQICSSSKGTIVKGVHQECLQESIELHNEKVQMQNLTKSPKVDTVSKLNQEAPQEPMEVEYEEHQIQRFTKVPEYQLHLEAIQKSAEISNKVNQIQSLISKFTEVSENEVHQEVFEESVNIQYEKSQTQSLQNTAHVTEDQKECLQRKIKHLNDEYHIESSSSGPSVNLVNELHWEALYNSTELYNEESQAQNKSTTPYVDLVSKLHQKTEGTLSSPPTENLGEFSSFSKQNCKDLQSTKDQPHTHVFSKPSKIKPKMELKRFSRPNLKNVKAKVVSRAASAPRPAKNGPSGSTLDPEHKLLSPSREEPKKIHQADVKKVQSSASQAEVITPVSDAQPKSTWPQGKTKPSEESQGSEVDINQEQNAGLRMQEERCCQKEDGALEKISAEINQSVPSQRRPPMVAQRVQSQGWASSRAQDASASGIAKIGVTDSSSAVCGPVLSWKPPQKPPSSKLPIKTGILTTSQSSSSLGSAVSENNANRGIAQGLKSEETCVRPPLSSQGKLATTKPTATIHNRVNTPTKPNTTGQKATTQANHSKTAQSSLLRGGSARPSRPSAIVCPSSRGSRGSRVVHTHNEEEEEKKSHTIHQLRKLLAHSNRKLEALAVVIQHIFNEKEEALKQKKEISNQLKNLRVELAQSVACCERLEVEKTSVCTQLDAAVLKLQQQHQAELVQLEDTFREFYSAEWDKAHQAYQDEADRYRELMNQQVEEIRSTQEKLRTEQEGKHTQHLEALKQDYETSLSELQKIQVKEKQELKNTLTLSEASHNERIEKLMMEKQILCTRLREEDERRTLTKNTQKDSRVVYLEQELESLKVVLDIKTDQLHQQDKKLMQMDKVIESNIQLEECVKKLQQENEDYKARMDKHSAISRQLSTEQTMLQQTLQKESKANKRLSMENEELLWKLHNGLSPRNSACFPSSPISPR
ncbi:microtubule-associated tumor suppressor 1 homolog [Trichomycterus rosablanca]|uniref:microtubule-associated tumor suppressor 1 homolog n=1 Tax=Trichomycterus rosablanca TaxID=2290929 RepID=UPI002F35183F